jgi:HEAT repeat protein
MQDKVAPIRADAAQALREIGPGAKGAIPALAKALNDSDPTVSYDAIIALGNMGDAAIPQLTAAVKSENPTVRRHAIVCLDSLGSDAKSAIPALLVAARDHDDMTRVLARQAVKDIDPAAAAQLPGS